MVVPFLAETPSLETNGSLSRILSSVTQTYLSCLTLTCHVDMTLQLCVNNEEKGLPLCQELPRLLEYKDLFSSSALDYCI